MVDLPVFWYRFSVPVSGACVIGIRHGCDTVCNVSDIDCSAGVLKESPCPQGFLRTNLQVLDLALGPQVLVLVLEP